MSDTGAQRGNRCDIGGSASGLAAAAEAETLTCESMEVAVRKGAARKCHIARVQNCSCGT